ncbi:MAG: helix-turn-helix domain-containing protein, partial [Bacillota bacterium]
MSVGSRLKKARKSLNLSIEDIRDKSKIKKNYLQAIENDDFDRLPGEVYTKVYIRGYAKIVGLDPQEILAEYVNEKKNKSNEKIESNNKKVKKDNNKN